MAPIERRMAAALREHGYKLTPQRKALLQVIARSLDHLTPAALYDKVRHEHPGIGLVTIYRTLDILAQLGLICEVHAGGNCRNYVVAPEEHHGHLICSECGRVVDFRGCGLDQLEERLSRETGFEIMSHLLEFLGRCRDCQ